MERPLRIRLFAIAIVFSALGAQAQKAVIVFEDRFNPPVSMKAGDAPTKGANAVWEWSENKPPVRRDLTESAKPVQSPGWLEVKVHPSPAKERMTLLAGPVDMWMEVPEGLLPAFTVELSPKPITVRIPVDSKLTWRVRLVAPSGGSWWVNVPPGRKALAIAPSPAVDRMIEVRDEQKARVADARLSLLDSNGDRGDYEKLADYRSDRQGRIFLPVVP